MPDREERLLLPSGPAASIARMAAVDGWITLLPRKRRHAKRVTILIACLAGLGGFVGAALAWGPR